MQRLDTDQKALEINLNDRIYGTFAEIGAGQEVARHFFKVGAAAGTIAKTMSAYDKVFSDKIYGEEKSGRYVCISRLDRMLQHEYDLMCERLENVRPDTNFFVFADTVAAIDFHKTVKGHGWLGLRFQLHPDGKPNDFLLHVRMLDNDNQLQQDAIGHLGVNIIYGCYHYHDQPEKLIRSLTDSIRERVRIDYVQLKGPDFPKMDDRLLALYLVKNGLSTVCMFDELGKCIHPSEFLYKKSLMVVRGNYRPPTIVSLDVFNAGWDRFVKDYSLRENKAYLMAEITLDNLMEDGKIDEEDFLARVECLKLLGYKTIISDCKTHQVLINYLSDYKIKNLGLVIGAYQLLDLIKSRYDEYSHGSLLVAFGELFSYNIKVYVYPALDEEEGKLLTSRNLPVPEGIKYLYQHLLNSGNIVDVEQFEKKKLRIQPADVLSRIRRDEEDWAKYVPEVVAKAIRENCLFGYPCHPLEFEI